MCAGRELLQLNEHWPHAVDLAAVLADAVASLEFGQTRRHLLIGLQDTAEALPLHSPTASSPTTATTASVPGTCAEAAPATGASCSTSGMEAQFSHWPSIPHRSAEVNSVEKLREWISSESGLLDCPEWKRKPYFDVSGLLPC